MHSYKVPSLTALAADAVVVPLRFWRPPLRINPEAIIQGSGLEALQVTSFLAENYPHFFAEDAIEQAAAAAAYFSDAGGLFIHNLRM
jgi:hypothetical protein